MNIRHASLADLESITAIEAACFPEAEAAKKKDFDFSKGSETAHNQKTVQAFFQKTATAAEPESVPETEPVTDPTPNRQHITIHATGDNRRNSRQQLLFSPVLFENVKKAAEKAGLSVNSYMIDRLSEINLEEIPKTSRISRETKSRRLQLVMPVKMRKRLKKAAASMGVSLNAYVCEVMRIATENGDKNE